MLSMLVLQTLGDGVRRLPHPPAHRAGVAADLVGARPAAELHEDGIARPGVGHLCLGLGDNHRTWCPSNDHSNDRYHEEITEAMRYAPDRMHKDGGYALRHRWM